jgi:peptidyl-Lys metalloendopeptidase
MSRTEPRLAQWVKVLIGVSLLSACGAPSDGETPRGDVEVSLSVAGASPGTAEVAVRVTFTNVSDGPVRLLKWYVPGTDGVKAELLEVSREGTPVEYLGPHAKRRAPRPEDFVTLAPGGHVSGLAPLSGLYDLSESGTYTVRFSAQVTGPRAVVLTRAVQLDSNALSLWLEGRAPHAPEHQAPGTVTAQGLSYIGCSSTRQTQLLVAWNGARTYASNASNHLAGLRSGSARYTSWFGTWSTSRRDTARAHYTSLVTALASAPLTLDCTCTDPGTYAYVYPSSPYRIYVCGAFWGAPTQGTDSRAGTLVHELSHFTVVAGTRDHAYGQSAALTLARSSAERALDNADNHEYFAENTPEQN